MRTLLRCCSDCGTWVRHWSNREEYLGVIDVQVPAFDTKGHMVTSLTTERRCCESAGSTEIPRKLEMNEVQSTGTL